jgi:hypothetical protein
MAPGFVAQRFRRLSAADRGSGSLGFLGGLAAYAARQLIDLRELIANVRADGRGIAFVFFFME